MRSFETRPDDQKALLEQAAFWRLRLQNDPDVENAPAFRDWMRDPDNAEYFRATDTSWTQIGAFAAAPEILEMREQALRRARRNRPSRFLSWTMAMRLAAAALLFACLGSAVTFYLLFASTSYATGVGERRIVALSDGSQISLDSNSQVEVRYTKTARILVLDHGRARFDVAHDVTRPFTVAAGTTTVIAVGTSFDVEKLNAKVVVTLIQGRIVVKSADPGQAVAKVVRVTSMQAGQVMEAPRNEAPRVSNADLQNVAAWEDGHLIFKNETLAEAVERINRYTEKPVTVDKSVANLRISGFFNAGDVGSFISAVTSYFPVQASITSDNGIQLQRRAS